MTNSRKLSHIFLVFLILLYARAEGAQSPKKVQCEVVKSNLYNSYNLKNLKVLGKKGDYVLGSVYGEKNHINWVKNFKIAELGGIYDKRVTADIISKREIQNIEHHIGYDWMPAFYYYTKSENREFVKWIYENRKSMTLNPEGPFLHCKKNGYDWCREYYYNLGNKELFKKRVENLISDMKAKRFNGLFFDWASGKYITYKEYKPVLEYFKKLNPKKVYFELVGDFYKSLKERGIFIVTNQAFRNEKYLLKYVDYDMTESYITSTKILNKEVKILAHGLKKSIVVSNYYPIYKNSKSIKDSLHFIDLLTSYKKRYEKYGFKNFIYLNYLAPEYEKVYDSAEIYKMVKPKNGIYFSYAMGKLTDNFVYAEVTIDKKLERDDVYFYDLGKPLGKGYEKLNGFEGYVRFYERGFVLASEAYPKDNIYLKIKSEYLPKKTNIFDAYEKVWLRSGDGGDLVVKLSYQKDTFSSKYLPLGRVYLYQYKGD